MYFFLLFNLGWSGGRGRPREDDGRHSGMEGSPLECKGVWAPKAPLQSKHIHRHAGEGSKHLRRSHLYLGGYYKPSAAVCLPQTPYLCPGYFQPTWPLLQYPLIKFSYFSVVSSFIWDWTMTLAGEDMMQVVCLVKQVLPLFQRWL